MHELLVIGAGTSGLRTALTAANNGTKTILVGNKPIGGTCLNNGCIPTKALLHAANIYRTTTQAKKYGINTKTTIDYKQLIKRVTNLVEEGKTHAEKSTTKHQNLRFIEGKATFIANNTIEINNERITAKKIIIATGTRPNIPPIPGLNNNYYTNENILERTTQPKKLAIIGGGYIACEYATFFATIGTKVTIIEKEKDILNNIDPDIRKYIKQSLEEMGVTILTETAVSKIEEKTIILHNKKRIQTETILIATGRTPNTETLKLEQTNVHTNNHGYITTNKHLQTNNKNIYAIGDVNGENQFAHAAKREGWIALEQILLQKKVNKPTTMPWAIFTHPIAAGFGKQEQEMNEPYNKLETTFSACGKANIIGEKNGKIKVLHQEGTIIGASIVGPQADNLIHELLALSKSGKNALDNLRKTIHIHPTLSEAMENLKETE